MGVVLRCCTGRGNILQPFDASPLLDIIRQVAACAKLHDKIHILLRALVRCGPSSTAERCESRGKGVRTIMSMSRVICRWDRDLRIWISLWRFSKSFEESLSVTTVLIATCWWVSWVRNQRTVSCVRCAIGRVTHLVVALVDSGEAALADIADDDIRAQLLFTSCSPC